MKIRNLFIPALIAAAALVNAADFTQGEIKKVDLQEKKVLLQHEEIKSLGMPAMTMNYQVRDEKLLSRFKAGDKVRFKAAQEGNKYFVTEMTLSK